jgi:hypothetical protein
MNMKKVSLGLVALLAVFSVKAKATDCGYGIKALGGSSMITNSDKFFSNNKAGLVSSAKLSYGAGIYGEYSLMDEVGIRLEALFNVVGAGYRGEREEEVYKVAYLTIPVLAKIYPMGVDTGFSVLVGPEIGFPIAMKTYTKKAKSSDIFKELTTAEYKPRKEHIEAKWFNNFAFGANVGFEYELSELGVNFGLAYVMNFTKFLNTDAKEVDGIPGERNGMLQNIRLNIGYNIATALA